MHPSFFPVFLQGKEVGTTFMWTEQDLHKSLACQPVLAGSLHYWKCFNGQLVSNIYSHLVIYCKSPRVISDSTFSPFRPPPAILLHFPQPQLSVLCSLSLLTEQQRQWQAFKWLPGQHHDDSDGIHLAWGSHEWRSLNLMNFMSAGFE